MFIMCEDFPCCGHTGPNGEVFCPSADGAIPCVDCGVRFIPGDSSMCQRCIRALLNYDLQEAFEDEGEDEDEGDYRERYGPTMYGF